MHIGLHLSRDRDDVSSEELDEKGLGGLLEHPDEFFDGLLGGLLGGVLGGVLGGLLGGLLDELEKHSDVSIDSEFDIGGSHRPCSQSRRPPP